MVDCFDLIRSLKIYLLFAVIEGDELQFVSVSVNNDKLCNVLSE